MALTPDEIDDFIRQGLTDEQISAVAQHVASQGAPETAPGAISLPSSPSPASAEGGMASRTAQAQPEAAKSSELGEFLAPAATADRAWEGVKAGTPFLQTLINKAQGKEAYSHDPEGAGRLAGDIGGTAAAIASGGVLPVAKFAGLSGVLNALGIPQGAARIGNAIEDAMPEPKAPSKVMGIEGLGTALNMLARAPGAAANVTAQALPYALAGKAIEPEVLAAKEGAPVPMEPRPAIPENEMPNGVKPMGTDQPALTQEQARAKALQDAGYPVTESHMIPGDTRLKAALGNPEVSAEAKAYMDKLSKASQADLAKSLDVGGLSSQQLGEQLGADYQKAMGKRSQTYKEMLAMADNPAGPVNTGIGQFTHAGQSLAKAVAAELKAKGLDLNETTSGGDGMTVRAKALVGGGLTPYDVPAHINPDEATAAIKFADLASQKAATPVELDSLAKNFAKREKLFQPGQGSASGSGFLRNIQGKATDLAADILKKRDAQIGPAGGEPTYPKWAEQRANWAKSADLVNEFDGKLSSPKTRLTGEDMYSSSRISPEKIFQKEFANAGADKVLAFKDFLKSNGQDPAILENMGKDWLLDTGNKAANPVQAIETAWRKMSPEYKKAVFSPETIVSLEDSLARTRDARSPLEVLGTKATGESPTQARLAIEKAQTPFQKSFPHLASQGAGATVGALAGGVVPGIGHIAGGAVGGWLGGKLGAMQDAKLATALEARQAQQIQAARDLLKASPEITPESLNPIAPLPPPRPIDVLKAKVASASQAANRPIPGTAPLPRGLPAVVLAAMGAQRNPAQR